MATGAAGTNAYADATGANGPEGQARAKANFQTDPGYNFQLQQGQENVLRNAGRTGGAGIASGGVALDLQKQGQGLADQSYGNYVNRLQPFMQLGMGAASGTAGANMGLGNLINSSYGTQGNAAYNTQTGIGNANANADLAGLTAGQNAWNGIMAGGKLATQALAMSDINAKDDIEPVGELYDGQQVYRYRYKGEDPYHIGLLAQEVEQIDPGAIGDLGGFKGVDYKRATHLASRLAEFL